MKLHQAGAEIFVPDGMPEEEALARTTHMAIGCHQDDIEIMAYDGVLKCFGEADKWLCGVTVTNGSGSPRDDLYADYSDEQMMEVRRQEQKKAAYVGEYTAQVLLDFSSSQVKETDKEVVMEDLKALIIAARPGVIYTHNLADKHDTHVGVTLRVIQALRELPAELHPQALYGCEVWRDLDWMVDDEQDAEAKYKIAFDVDAHPNLAAALLGVFDSQDCGGKRYDLASLGRRVAHATYYASHEVDVTQAMIFAMNLTPLIQDVSLGIGAYIDEQINRFAADVSERIAKFE